MHRDLGRGLYKRLFVFAIVIALTTGGRVVCAQTPDEGGVSFDGGGEEVLQSIFVPFMAHAPFSLILTAEWSRPMNNGGTFTTVNSRPIKRDSLGRIYQERWLMSPKGSNIPSRMSWIQIADPVAHTFYQCNAPQKLCELLTLRDSVTFGSILPGLSRGRSRITRGRARGRAPMKISAHSISRGCPCTSTRTRRL